MTMKLRRKIGTVVAVTALALLCAAPVSADECRYEFDQQAVGFGNINKEGTAYTYSQYVLGSNAVAAQGIAKYSVGKGDSNTNVVSRRDMTATGTVAPGVTKSAGKTEKVTICLYENSTPVASAVDI